MYKVTIQHLEKTLKALEMAQRALTSGKSTKITNQEVNESIKILKDEYLFIKPNYSKL